MIDLCEIKAFDCGCDFAKDKDVTVEYTALVMDGEMIILTSKVIPNETSSKGS